jgi:hypothetical protein
MIMLFLSIIYFGGLWLAGGWLRNKEKINKPSAPTPSLARFLALHRALRNRAQLKKT